MAVAAVVAAGVVAEAGVEVAAVVLVTIAVVLVRPFTLYRPSSHTALSTCYMGVPPQLWGVNTLFLEVTIVFGIIRLEIR